jgi:hypothetical protein
LIAQGPCTYTDLYLTAPLKVAEGLSFTVSATVTNPALVEQPIYTYVYAVGDKSGKTWDLIDLYQYFPSGTQVTYTSQTFTMPAESITIHAYNYIWYQDKWVSECHKTQKVEVLPEEVAYYLIIAEGKTPEEFKADLEGKEITGKAVLIIDTTLPESFLKTVYWFNYPAFLAAKAQFEAQGGKLEKIEIIGSSIYIFIEASPLEAIVVYLIIAAFVTIAGIAITKYIRDMVLGIQATKQQALAAESAKTLEELIKLLLAAGATPEQATEFAKYWSQGYGIKQVPPEEKWYEKYIKYALIGGGVIAALAIVLPRVIEAGRARA